MVDKMVSRPSGCGQSGTKPTNKIATIRTVVGARGSKVLIFRTVLILSSIQIKNGYRW